MSPRTIAPSLQELCNSPHIYEVHRRLYLWKHFLYTHLGDEHIKEVNNLLKECKVLADTYTNLTASEALEKVLNPTHRPKVILHHYPEIAKKSIDFLLHGVGEEVICSEELEKAEIVALNCLRERLEQSYS